MTASSDDVQRLFLQAMFSRGILSEKLAQVIWKKCVEAVKNADESLNVVYSDTEDAWDNFVRNVNQSLNDLDYEFKSIQDELNGKRLFALVNRKDDELAQMATDYTAIEMSYFKAVVEQIMLARNEAFSVSSLAALREVSAGKEKMNLTKTQAEVLLGSFVANGWLLRSKRGRYSLSPRSLLELLPYLKSTYPDEIIECTICHEIVTRGVACKRDNCKTRMHYHCFSTYRRRKTACPACAFDWPQNAPDDSNGPGLLPVGELAVRDGDDGRRQTRGSPDSDEDEDEEMEDGEQSQSQKKPRQSQRQSQSSRKGRSRKSKKNADSEEEEMEEEENEDDEDEAEAEATPPPTSKRRSSRR